MEEIWRDIPWYIWEYQVSNLWMVKSLKFWKENILKQINSWWYKILTLYKNKLRKQPKIHRLIAIAFIPNPENKPEVNHKNWIRDDNRIENLEWVTAKENMQHAFKTWLCKNNHFIKNHPRTALWKFWKDSKTSKPVHQYTLEWKFIKEWWSIIEVERELWIYNQNISKCCKWEKWRKSAGWFIWKYK